MTIRHMRIFLAVCREGYSMTKAAASLHMTQPAVSLAVRELEDYYGTPLFDRLGRSLVLTQAGRRLHGYAAHIASLFEESDRAVRDWEHFGLLRVGASFTIGSRFLPDDVKTFLERHPDVKLRVSVLPSKYLESGLLDDSLDVALMEGVAHSPVLTSREYKEDRLAAVCAPDGPYRSGETISLSEFSRQNFLLRDPGSGTREEFDRVMEAAGVSVTPVWESMSTQALLHAAMRGLGVAVLPLRMAEEAIASGRVVSLNVEGLSFYRRFRMVWHRDKYLTPLALAFLEHCRARAKES